MSSDDMIFDVMIGKILKKTFTYASRPDVVAKAKENANKAGTTLSEEIDKFVTEYAKKKIRKNKTV